MIHRLMLILFPTDYIHIEPYHLGMGRGRPPEGDEPKHPDKTSIPVQKKDHRKAREVKRDGETWSLFIRRAAEKLDENW